MHQGAVERNRVVDFELVPPPIRERRSHGTVLRHLLGDFVAFKDVLECSDRDIEVVQRSDQCEDFILAIAVTMNPTVTVDDLQNRIEFQVLARRYSLACCFPGLPLLLVLFRRDECVAHDLFDAQSRLRIASPMVLAPVALFDVLAEREFDALRRFGELHLFGEHAPAEFEDLVLASDRIGRTMQDVGRGYAASELTINRNVGRIDKVSNANFRRDRLRALVHTAVGCHVRMAVDDARREVLSFRIDTFRTFGDLEFGADANNLPFPNEDRSIFQDSLRPAGPNGCVFDENGSLRSVGVSDPVST